MRRRQADKRGHDSPHRAEQPDKRARGAGGGQKRGPVLHLGQLDVGLPLHRARHVVDPAQVGRESALRPDRLALGAGEMEQLLVAGPEHLRHRAMRQTDAGGVNRREVLGFPENLDEALGLPPGPRYLHHLVQADPPASDRESDQNPQHRRHHGAGAQHQLQHAQLPRRAHLMEHKTALPPQLHIIWVSGEATPVGRADRWIARLRNRDRRSSAAATPGGAAAGAAMASFKSRPATHRMRLRDTGEARCRQRVP